MPEQQSANFSMSASLSSARAKLITALVIIALVLGVITEALSMVTGFYNLRKARCDAAMSAVNVEVGGTAGIGGRGRPENKVHAYVADCIGEANE